MAIIVTVATQKGGSCKTSTVVNLACALAAKPHNKKVLVVDVDAQANASLTLGTINPAKQPVTVSLLFDNDPSATFSQAITDSKFPGVDLIPSNIDLFSVAAELAYGNPAAVLGLQSKLDSATLDKYDFILIDTPPNLGGPFVINAMVITDYFIIPVESGSLYAMMGMEQFLGSINAVKGCSKHKLDILGILLTRYDARTSASKVVHDMVVKRFGSLVFNTIIRKSTSLEQANIMGKPALLHEKRSNAVQDYAALAEEFLERIEKSEKKKNN